MNRSRVVGLVVVVRRPAACWLPGRPRSAPAARRSRPRARPAARPSRPASRAWASSCALNFAASLATSSRDSGASFGREGRVELLPGRHRLRVGRVVERRPHDDVEQLAQHLQRGLRRDRPVLVDGGVADLADQVQLLRDPDADLGLEAGVVDPGREVVLVGRRQSQDVVEVADELLDRPAAVEARRPRVGRQVRLRPRAVGVQGRQRRRTKSKLPMVASPGVEAGRRQVNSCRSRTLTAWRACIQRLTCGVDHTTCVPTIDPSCQNRMSCRDALASLVRASGGWSHVSCRIVP